MGFGLIKRKKKMHFLKDLKKALKNVKRGMIE
jgi:hypothetical protein